MLCLLAARTQLITLYKHLLLFKSKHLPDVSMTVHRFTLKFRALSELLVKIFVSLSKHRAAEFRVFEAAQLPYFHCFLRMFVKEVLKLFSTLNY